MNFFLLPGSCKGSLALSKNDIFNGIVLDLFHLLEKFSNIPLEEYVKKLGKELVMSVHGPETIDYFISPSNR